MPSAGPRTYDIMRASLSANEPGLMLLSFGMRHDITIRQTPCQSHSISQITMARTEHRTQSNVAPMRYKLEHLPIAEAIVRHTISSETDDCAARSRVGHQPHVRAGDHLQREGCGGLLRAAHGQLPGGGVSPRRDRADAGAAAGGGRLRAVPAGSRPRPRLRLSRPVSTLRPWTVSIGTFVNWISPTAVNALSVQKPRHDLAQNMFIRGERFVSVPSCALLSCANQLY